MGKEQPLCQHTEQYGISGKLQEIICLLAQSHVFEEGEEIVKQLLGLNISAKQIQRVSQHYGEVLETQVGAYISSKEKAPVLKLKTPQEPVYIMFDGSMLFTREEAWKEMKVGRIFTESSCIAIQDDRRNRSMYATWAGINNF